MAYEIMLWNSGILWAVMKNHKNQHFKKGQRQHKTFQQVNKNSIVIKIILSNGQMCFLIMQYNN